MNKGMTIVLSFTAGMAAGIFTGKKMLEQHYEQKVEEEIESVKEAFRRYSNQPANPKKKDKQEEHVSPQESSSTSIQPMADRKKTDYQKYYPSNKPAEKTSDDSAEERPPYVIAPDEFDTLADYEAISLKLYADGTVADDDDRAMSEEDIERTITRANLAHIGEYEPGSVFIRNEAMRVDYEVLTYEKDYEEVLNEKPYLR